MAPPCQPPKWNRSRNLTSARLRAQRRPSHIGTRRTLLLLGRAGRGALYRLPVPRPQTHFDEDAKRTMADRVEAARGPSRPTLRAALREALAEILSERAETGGEISPKPEAEGYG